MSASTPDPTMRLVKLECGHEVLASATAFVVRCAICKRLIRRAES